MSVWSLAVTGSMSHFSSSPFTVRLRGLSRKPVEGAVADRLSRRTWDLGLRKVFSVFKIPCELFGFVH